MDSPARQSDDGTRSGIPVDLLTARHGSSGGHKYNDHLLSAAPRFGFAMRTVRPGIARLPPATIMVIDSLVAWKLVVALRRAGRRRTVALVHQQPGGADGPRYRRSVRAVLDMATYRRCDLIVAAGTAVAEMLCDQGLDPARVEVVEPGCDLPPFRERPPLRAGNRIGVLDVANWLPNKGIHELLDAVASLPHDDVTLHLAGTTDIAPGYRTLVESRLRRADLAGRVVVHGALAPPAVASLYAAADVLVFPSHAEAYGSVVAEAMAMGLPVIGWRTPHMCALVEDEVEGILVPKGDIAALRDAIHRVAIDTELRATLADGARRRGARLPTWGQTTSRFFGALDRLLTEAVEPPDRRTTIDDIDPTD